jgi:hypothetical protein
MCRTERDIIKTLNLDVIGVSNRLLRLAVESTAPGTVMAGTIARRSLTPVEVILPYDISMKFLQKNIEGSNAEATINRMFAKQFGTDSVDLAFNGDTADVGADKDFLNIIDGYLVKALADGDAHNDNFAAVDPMADVLAAMLKTLPAKWRTDRAGLRYFCSPGNEDKYRDELGVKNTSLGDLMILSNNPVVYKGIQVKPLSCLGDDKIMLTRPDNLAIGYGPDMRVGRFLDERKRLLEYTITTDIDANYVISDQIVLFTKV